MPAGEMVDEIFDVTPYPEGVLRAEVSAQGDAFDLDDFAYTLVLPHRSKRVLVVTDGNAFLETRFARCPASRSPCRARRPIARRRRSMPTSSTVSLRACRHPPAL